MSCFHVLKHFDIVAVSAAFNTVFRVIYARSDYLRVELIRLRCLDTQSTELLLVEGRQTNEDNGVSIENTMPLILEACQDLVNEAKPFKTIWHAVYLSCLDLQMILERTGKMVVSTLIPKYLLTLTKCLRVEVPTAVSCLHQTSQGCLGPTHRSA